MDVQSITLGISNSRKLMATACKATEFKHAVIRIYDTDKFQPFGAPLEGHALTVTRISFSPDDQHILTVSRDRTWRLFRSKDGKGEMIRVYLYVIADRLILWRVLCAR